MSDDHFPRKLAVILYADVVAYSRHSGEDEDATHRRLRQRLDHLSHIVVENGGSVVHYAGDAVLARFEAAVNAVNAALAVQRSCKDSTDANDANPLCFRIGVNLGDVIEDQGDIYGDGVNIAARLETLAEPGGICVSDSVRTALGTKLAVDFENLGPQQVKNIAVPVNAYRLLFDGQTGYESQSPAESNAADVRPSILVLPFKSATQDAEGSYLVEGITDEVRLGLCRFKTITVIARGSSAKLAETAGNSLEAANSIDADYVLEGNVRTAGNRLRVSVELINASSGQQMWADRYDRTLEDLFAIQDEISQRIVTKLIDRIEDESKGRALQKPSEDLTAYDYFLRGNYYFGDWKASREDTLVAGEMYQRAVDIDPEYAAAYAGLAGVHQRCFERGWMDSPEATGELAIELAHRAVELDPNDAGARLVLASSYFKVRQSFELADTQIKMALELNPNAYWAYCFKCYFSTCAGDLDEGIQCGVEAIQRNPLLPDGCLNSIGFAEYLAGRYELAIKAYGRMSKLHADDEACLAACYAQLGRLDEARAAADEFRRRIQSEDPERDPGTDAESWKAYWMNTFPLKEQKALEHFIDGLEKAGLLER